MVTTKQRARAPYEEGQVFRVPLAVRGSALAVVARKDGRGVVLCYLFLCDAEPSSLTIAALRPGAAETVMMVGDAGLLHGTWPLVGWVAGFDRSAWSLPAFRHQDLLSGAWSLRHYGEDLGRFRSEGTSEAEALRHPQDGLLGFRAVENELTRRAAARRSAA